MSSAIATDRPERLGIPRTALIFWLLAALAVVVGILHASSLTYLSDDSFVSFRYARNLVDGFGLVYNAGEKVEGYTNLLWTLIIAFGLKLGISPEPFSTDLGIACFGLTILLWSLVSWKFRASPGWRMAPIPLAALALALHRDAGAHATSGMETSFFILLLTLAFAIILLGKSPRSAFLAGIVFVLAMMTRPDGIIFLAGTAVYLLITERRPIPKLIALLLPSVFLFLPYWLWRWSYYGFFFPNTFYAKSVDLSYYSQGLVYLFLYLKTYYVFGLLGILVVVNLWRHRGILRGGSIIRWFRQELSTPAGAGHPLLLGTILAGSYIIFIVRLGGDFMFARFLIPITPILFFMMEVSIARLSGDGWNLALAGVVLVCTFFRNDQYRDNSFVGYIADERRYFTVDEPLDESRREAAIYRKYLSGLPVKVAFWAGQLRLVYYADFPVAIEASAGLTDTAIAHRQLGARGRPGHEKNATLPYLERRGVNFYIGPTDAPPPGALVLNSITFDSLRARIIVYQNDLMSKLERYPGVKFVQMPQYLDNYIAGIDTLSRTKVEEDYLFLRSFYFDHNNDSLREEAILRHIIASQTP